MTIQSKKSQTIWHKALHTLQKAHQTITIKPADKNLGIVLLNTDDYVAACLAHLTDKNTYTLTTIYPTSHIADQLSTVLAAFKQTLSSHDRRLYKYLSEPTQHIRIPRFYGIPKIHKQFTTFPPLRPIVSQTASILSPSAHFIDHILQPVAQTYPDYLRDSTTLSIALQDLHVPDEAILVTVDVASLYPSIPQAECLKVIYNELHAHRLLLAFDPNLIIKLLHVNINNTYFTFRNQNFQQINGTAMGAPFSPTVANIYMSIILKNSYKLNPLIPSLLGGI